MVLSLKAWKSRSLPGLPRTDILLTMITCTKAASKWRPFLFSATLASDLFVAAGRGVGRATRTTGSRPSEAWDHGPALYAVPCRSGGPRQSHRHRPDVPVLGGRRLHDRLASDPPRASGAVGRRVAHHRGDRRRARGTHHLRRRRPVVGRDRGRDRPHA